MNISDNDNAQNLELAREVAQYFRINPNQANTIIEKTSIIVRQWHQEAKKLKISSDEQDLMARAFRAAEL